MTNFKNLGIPPIMLEALTKMNFATPTPIQEPAIPVALEGHDILGSAQTGTGKTASFAIPMINHLLNNRDSSALVLLPTRELAAQVLEAANKMLGSIANIKSALLIGGDSMVKQLQQLKRSPRIIVGTPGRINDHLSRKSLNLKSADFLVLDETDRMLDMGFGIQLNEIAKFLPKERQTLMFSATLPKNITALSKKYLNNPVRIAVGNDNEVAPKIKQEIIKTSDGTKYNDLVNQINIRNGSLLVFVKTKFGADRLAVKLNKENLSAAAIHGDLRQSKRERVIADFRKQKFRVLVATDIAARGLDIPHIENVVNYDLPQCPEDYIHRIGRTGRAGAEGMAINFLTSKDGAKWKEIHKLLNPTSRDKAMLSDMPTPVSADPISTPVSNNKGKAKPKAKTTAKNPFKPFAPDKKAKNRDRFNKNSKTFGSPIRKIKAKKK
ncbi:MAG: DEAD/DEAH box helicase [Lactobacillus sp.]|jgi:superfamily II DNA/RNA helicase|nr:DEAD/DEAH box helicase [Lactobacillus sp.]